MKVNIMLPGKVPSDVLEQYVFPFLGKKNHDVILGPGLGEDASLIRVGEKVIVAATDPITGSTEDVGWLAVNVNANDIATFGVHPRWYLCSILLPPGTSPSMLGRIMRQMNEAADELDIAITGGHSEITEGIDRPIVAGFMIGVTNPGEYVTSSGAKPGDSIIVTKTAGLEGTAILAAEDKGVLSSKLSQRMLEDAKALKEQISVVKDGTAAFDTGFVTAMHDPTEGGLAGGLHEICDASDVGFEVIYEEIPVHETTEAICSILNIDYLDLISSGCMVITCKQNHTEELIAALQKRGIDSTLIGKIVEDRGRRQINRNGEWGLLSRPKTDILWTGLKMVSSGNHER